MIPGELQPVRASGIEKNLENALHKLSRDIEFPSEFSDIGDPARAHYRVAELDFLRRGEREALVG